MRCSGSLCLKPVSQYCHSIQEAVSKSRLDRQRVRDIHYHSVTEGSPHPSLGHCFFLASGSQWPRECDTYVTLLCRRLLAAGGHCLPNPQSESAGQGGSPGPRIWLWLCRDISFPGKGSLSPWVCSRWEVAQEILCTALCWGQPWKPCCHTTWESSWGTSRGSEQEERRAYGVLREPWLLPGTRFS